jgi:hypothetical protein
VPHSCGPTPRVPLSAKARLTHLRVKVASFGVFVHQDCVADDGHTCVLCEAGARGAGAQEGSGRAGPQLAWFSMWLTSLAMHTSWTATPLESKMVKSES